MIKLLNERPMANKTKATRQLGRVVHHLVNRLGKTSKSIKD